MLANDNAGGAVTPPKKQNRYTGHPTNPTATPYSGHPTNPAVVRTPRIATKLAITPVASPIRRATYSASSTSSTPAPAPVGPLERRTPVRYERKNYGWGLGLRGLVLPVRNDDMTFTDAGDFGDRVHPVTGGYSNHTGVDMSGAYGTPIRAVAPGIVEQANLMDNVYGNQLILGHGKQQETMYGHMAQLIAEEGERVRRGQVIGYMGSTGMSTGDHLHFETWNKGQPVDPLQYLRPENMISNMQDAIDPETRTRMINRRRSAQQIIGSGAPGGMAESSASPVSPMGPASPASPASPMQRPMPMQQQSNPQMQAFLQAISQQESGNNYGAVGVPTGSGTAYGKYQILDQNFVNPGGWDLEALDKDITLEQYMRNPKFQEKIARTKLRDYFQQYGPGGAAKAWYAGPGNADLNSDSAQYGGPSVNDYSASVLQLMIQMMQDK